MYKSILVAVDGSEHANLAVDTAAALSVSFDAQVHLVHAAEQHPLILGSASVMSVVPEEELLRHGAAILDAAKQRAAAVSARKLHVHNLTEPGSAAHTILGLADEIKPDLIVVGSLGHGNLAGLMMGSVSQKLCQLAKCSCLVVR
jgi:nucleotide-binding universal stress UspA family protein